MEADESVIDEMEELLSKVSFRQRCVTAVSDS